MRIKTFCKFIDEIALKNHTINNSTLVIDGQNFFYGFYEKSGIQFVFGCESDKYAESLRKYLSGFKKANVKCYFVFKGGHENIDTKFNKGTDAQHGYDFSLSEEFEGIVLPIFMKDVYKQVLDEMGFDYVICEYESKREVIALAQNLNCPVCSYDIEFAFSGMPYIPYPSIKYHEKKNVLNCSLFILDKFERDFHLSDELLAIFIILTDIKIFPENHFLTFIKTLRIPLGHYKRNLSLLQWLSRTTRGRALEQIFRHITAEDKTKFLEEEIKIKNWMRRRETLGIPSGYLQNGNKVQILEKDPLWFEKGVASKHIAIPYVNLYRSDTQFGSWAIADKDAEDAMMLSIKILKYAYNLLTNFQKEEFAFFIRGENFPVTVPDCVQKPNSANALIHPFENGWDKLKSLEYFEHFIIESLQGFDFTLLEKLPDNAKLLMIALVYFSRQKLADTTNEVYCILLSYIALSVLKEKGDSNNNLIRNSTKPTTDVNLITSNDKSIAVNILAEYFSEVNKREAENIFDAKLIHPLVEFQHCLQNLNFLNKLCGCPYTPTVYSKTFNGTFVYKIAYAIKNEYENDGLDFIIKKLNPAASVLAFLNGLIDFYEEVKFA